MAALRAALELPSPAATPVLGLVAIGEPGLVGDARYEWDSLVGLATAAVTVNLRGPSPYTLPGEATTLAVEARAHLALKIILNTVTTLAKVAEGVVFGNRMINMGINNNKLYYRAIDMIATLMAVPTQRAHACLLGAIYGAPGLAEAAAAGVDDEGAERVRHHIEIATPRANVLPRALLLAGLGDDALDTLDDLLASEPSVARVLEAHGLVC